MRVVRFPVGTSLLALAILFPFTHCITEDSSTFPTMTDVNEFPEARKSPRYLCVQGGCTCDAMSGNAEENMMANCNCQSTKSDGSANPKISSPTFMKFSGVRFPPNLKIVRISNCDFLDIGANDEFSQLHFTEISIQNSIGVTIRPLAFKKVSNFTVKNVEMLSFENRAFDNLEADIVHFKNVTFNKNNMDNFNHVGTFGPIRINTALEFRESKLSTDMKIQINQEDVTNLTVSIRNCELEGLKGMIKTNRFELIGNNFTSLCSIKANVPLIPVNTSPNGHCESEDNLPTTSIEFSKSMELNSNTYNRERMPDLLFSVEEKGIMDISFPDEKKPTESTVAETAEKWLAMFTFEFKGNLIRNRTRSNIDECKEKWVWGSKPPKYQIFCPTPQSMKDFVRSGKFKPLFRRPTNSSSASTFTITFFSLGCALCFLNFSAFLSS
ncbi:uncharacterized protein LOC130694918 [Daphnia carinata]|uniref:uncharacterized protein LOC130694918 n=1 Tax=Daphnia carinata TaxID=120202 RepID=UPI00257C58FE|nr:uncharacterized protein LOC130694918 [Daphnia carinata]